MYKMNFITYRKFGNAIKQYKVRGARFIYPGKQFLKLPSKYKKLL